MEHIQGDGFGCTGRQPTASICLERPSAMPDQYVWLVWSSAFLVPWLGAYVAFPRHRKAMVWASLMTAPLGLTEPLFVPHYWNPPSLFDLARRNGFDIESVIFSFATGGIAAVLYNLLTGRALLPVSAADRHSLHHKMHYWALATDLVRKTWMGAL